MAVGFLYVSGAGDEENIPSRTSGEGYTTNWECVQPTATDPPTETSYSIADRIWSDLSYLWKRDIYTISQYPVSIVSFDELEFFYYSSGYGTLGHDFKYVLKQAGSVWESASVEIGASHTFLLPGVGTLKLATNPITGLAWTVADLSALQMGVTVYDMGGMGLPRIAYCLARLNDVYFDEYPDGIDSDIDHNRISGLVHHFVPGTYELVAHLGATTTQFERPEVAITKPNTPVDVGIVPPAITPPSEEPPPSVIPPPPPGGKPWWDDLWDWLKQWQGIGNPPFFIPREWIPWLKKKDKDKDK